MWQNSAKTPRMGSPAAHSRDGVLVKQLNIIDVVLPAEWARPFARSRAPFLIR